MLVLLFGLGCGEPCPERPSVVFDDLDPNAQYLVDRVRNLDAILGRTGPVCLDEVVFSPVAASLGESWREPPGWTVALPPSVSSELMRHHVCVALLHERRPLSQAPAALGLDADTFLEACATPFSDLGSCSEKTEVQRWVHEQVYSEGWPMAEPTTASELPSQTFSYRRFHDAQAHFSTDRGNGLAFSHGEDLEIRWFTPFGEEVEWIEGFGRDLGSLTSDGERIVGWTEANQLVVVDMETGERTVVPGQDEYRSSPRILAGDRLISWRTYGLGAIETTDLVTGERSSFELPPSTHPGFDTQTSWVAADPNDPERLFVSWVDIRYQRVLSDVTNVYVNDRYLGVVDLREDRWQTLLRSSYARGDASIEPFGVTSTGEVLMAGGWAYDSSTGAVRSLGLPCLLGERGWSLHQDHAVSKPWALAPDLTWRSFSL